MFTTTTKSLVAALVLAGVSLTAVAAYAVPARGPSAAEQNWLDRASNGGHHTGDTNGF
jgi:hypothetical protein